MFIVHPLASDLLPLCGDQHYCCMLLLHVAAFLTSLALVQNMTHAQHDNRLLKAGKNMFKTVIG